MLNTQKYHALMSLRLAVGNFSTVSITISAVPLTEDYFLFILARVLQDIF